MPSQCVQSFHDLLLTPPCSPHLAHTLPPPSSPVPRDYNARAAESAGKGATGGLQGSSVCGFVLGIFFIVWSQLHSSDIAACAAEHSFTLGMGITVVTTACVSLCTGCVNCVVVCCAKDDADDVDHIGMWCGRCGLRRCSPRAISPALAPQSVVHPSLTLFVPLSPSLSPSLYCSGKVRRRAQHHPVRTRSPPRNLELRRTDLRLHIVLPRRLQRCGVRCCVELRRDPASRFRVVHRCTCNEPRRLPLFIVLRLCWGRHVDNMRHGGWRRRWHGRFCVWKRCEWIWARTERRRWCGWWWCGGGAGVSVHVCDGAYC